MKVTITIEDRADDGRMAEIAVEADFHGEPPPHPGDEDAPLHPVHLLALAGLKAMTEHASFVADAESVPDNGMTPSERVAHFQDERRTQSKSEWR